MSAYVVSQTHIAAIVRAALRGPSHERAVSPDSAWYGVYWDNPAESMNGRKRLDHENVDQVAAMLTAECVASVSYRYPDDKPDELPGPAEPYWIEPTDWIAAINRAPALSAVAALKAIDCYEYQSCEHPGWRGSEAHDFCNELRGALIGYLPGYAEASWEVDRLPVTA